MEGGYASTVGSEKTVPVEVPQVEKGIVRTVANMFVELVSMSQVMTSAKANSAWVTRRCNLVNPVMGKVQRL